MTRNRMCSWPSALVVVACVSAPSAGWAQEPGAAPAGPTPTQVGDQPAEGAKAEPTATAGAAAPAENGEAKTPIPAWFRVDADNLGLQVWAGATHTVGPLSIASDVYLMTSGFAEFDIGPSFTMGPVTLLPMVGMGFNFIDQTAATLVAPQFYTYISAAPIYFESWLQVLLNSPFAEGTQNSFYTRNFLMFYPIEALGFGPHVELTVDLNEVKGASLDPAVPGEPDDTGLASLQLGGVLGLKYGANTSLLMYLGYETQTESQLNDKLAGRFTFVYNW